jgi:hypothetical protein
MLDAQVLFWSTESDSEDRVSLALYGNHDNGVYSRTKHVPSTWVNCASNLTGLAQCLEGKMNTVHEVTFDLNGQLLLEALRHAMDRQEE